MKTYAKRLTHMALSGILLGGGLLIAGGLSACQSEQTGPSDTTDSIATPRDSATDMVRAARPAQGYEVFSVPVTYEGDTARYEDYGFVCLPENYDPEGDPIPMVILCQGTDERTQSDTDPRGFHGISYFLAKGYAVMDMNGASYQWTRQHGFPVDGHHFAHRGLLQSYVQGYHYVVNKYNIQPQVYVMGISMGGGSSFMLVQHRVIPVRAQVAFCPAFSLLKQVYLQPWIGRDQQVTIAGQWGLPGWKTATPSQAYMLQHRDRWWEWDNLFYGVEGQLADIEQALTNNRNDAEAQAFARLSKDYPCPLLIFHCENDRLVDIRYSRYIQGMIQRGGGQATLTTFPTGGHGGGWMHGRVTDTDIHGHSIQTSECFQGALRFIQGIE